VEHGLQKTRGKLTDPGILPPWNWYRLLDLYGMQSGLATYCTALSEKLEHAAIASGICFVPQAELLTPCFGLYVAQYSQGPAAEVSSPDNGSVYNWGPIRRHFLNEARDKTREKSRKGFPTPVAD
jgi:hypothetical protein